MTEIRNRKLSIIITVAAVILLFAAVLVLSSCSTEDAGGSGQSAENDLKAYFLDVGQADCTLLVSQGEAIMIDAGNRDDAQLITGYLDELGIRELKFIIFTHPHEDHIGSGEAVIEAFDVGSVYMMDEYTEGMEGYLTRAVNGENIPINVPSPGDKADFGECSVEFLGPDRIYSDANDESICVKVTHGNNAMMFTGDAGSGPERAMIENGFDLEADLLHAGHHGSSTSNSYYFLREVNPKYVVISCGKGNMYGHPHEETLSRFNDLGAEIFRTDEQGTIIATDDGKNITFNCEGKKPTRSHADGQQEAEYIGNVNSKVYHSSDCSGLPNEENRVYFVTLDAAEKAGYRPCGRCNPQ